VQRDRPSVVERMGQNGGRDDPLDPVALELQLAHGRRDGGHRHEGGVHVVDVAGQRQRLRARRAAGLGSALQHRHVHAGPGQVDGGDQAVVAGPDDECAHGRVLPALPQVTRRGRVARALAGAAVRASDLGGSG
jgi:hypothetical protein